MDSVILWLSVNDISRVDGGYRYRKIVKKGVAKIYSPHLFL